MAISLYKKDFWNIIRQDKVIKINRVLECNLKQQLLIPKSTDELSFVGQDPLMYIIRNNSNNNSLYQKDNSSLPNQTKYFNFTPDELWKIIKRSNLKTKDKKDNNAFIYLLKTQQLKHMNVSQIKFLFNKSEAFTQPKICLENINQFNNCSNEDIETMLKQMNWEIDKKITGEPLIIHLMKSSHHFILSKNFMLKVFKDTDFSDNYYLTKEITELCISNNPQYLPYLMEYNSSYSSYNTENIIFTILKENDFKKEKKNEILNLLKQDKVKDNNKNKVLVS